MPKSARIREAEDAKQRRARDPLNADFARFGGRELFPMTLEAPDRRLFTGVGRRLCQHSSYGMFGSEPTSASPADCLEFKPSTHPNWRFDMQHQHITANPFALLMNPEAVHAALAQSDRLNSLKSRVWRPLDQPLIPRATTDVASFDEEVDATEDADDSNR
jgi:hypothetical protein